MPKRSLRTPWRLVHIAFALAPITRQERADASRPLIAAEHNPKLRAFLEFVLSQYVKEGVGELDRAKLPHLLEPKYRAVSDAAAELGGAAHIGSAFVGFQRHLYSHQSGPSRGP
ncbi:MAG: type I restriction-modification enzyme R subunit C-terminal domain-containing protein [Acetobacteraceae bacterium]